MNRPWDDFFLQPGSVATRCREKTVQTGLGGLSQGFQSDFWLRGYRMLGQMTGEISLVQGLFLALTGRVPTREEDRLLNAMFINNGLTDPRLWPFRAARLAATVKSPPTASLAAGLLVNEGTFLGSGAAYNASSFFYQARQRIREKQATLTDLVRERLAAGQIIGGYGRVLARGPDERNQILLDVARQCGLGDGEYLQQAFAIEKILQEQKNAELYMNSAGLICSLLLDLGMVPSQIMIYCAQLFMIGMSGNIVEAFEEPPGAFLALTNDDIAYTGPPRREPPVRDQPGQTLVNSGDGVRTVVLDSVSFLTEQNKNDFVVCGSHGGLPAAQYALRYSPRAIVFSDAGRGKDDAGIEGLAGLAEAGIPAMTVSVASARIGDGMDTYRHGIISAVNRIAEEHGLHQGMTVPQAIRSLAESTTVGGKRN